MKPDFAGVEEMDGDWCPLCGEWAEGLDLLTDFTCAGCAAKLDQVFHDDQIGPKFAHRQ